MSQHGNHYEEAFSAYLRLRKTPFITVDESRRGLLEEVSLKSFDFVVYSPRNFNLIVDVKGRKFPSAAGKGQKWENWVTEDDISSLLHWQQVFGHEFRSLLVFAYFLMEERYRNELSEAFDYKNRTYSFYGIWTDEYRGAMTRRSPKWNTVCLLRRNFRKLSRPLSELL